MALQLFLMNRAQQDILNEFTRLSHSINSATEAYYLNILDSLDEMPEHLPEAVKQDFPFRLPERDVMMDSLYRELSIELKKVQESLPKFIPGVESIDVWEGFSSYYRQDSGKSFPQFSREILKEKVRERLERGRDEFLEELDVLQHARPPLADPAPNGRARTRVQPINPDAPRIEIEKIDINLNQPKDLKTRVFVRTREPRGSGAGNGSSNTFSFRVPDFSMPDQPRILRYHYDTAEMNDALVKIRNRNILITSALFLLAIGGIFVISRRFTRPIHSVKTAFEKVVNGELDVSVTSGTRDEIGDLTRSFNHMVAELQRNREREQILQRKERLASLGQLAAGVAHEIKNPLNAINLTIEHLRDKYTAKDDQKALLYIETIRGEIRRLDKIVNNFLSFIRSENLEKADTDVNELIRHVLHLFERELKAQNIAVHTTFAGEFIFSLDGERFKTVLMNIILNAIQAMPKGGELQVVSDSAAKMISIKDSGPGIPEKDREHIFDLFYTTKSTGTGLGLPTAYKIVKEHGGEIKIHSREGEGTEVQILLSTQSDEQGV